MARNFMKKDIDYKEQDYDKDIDYQVLFQLLLKQPFSLLRIRQHITHIALKYHNADNHKFFVQQKDHYWMDKVIVQLAMQIKKQLHAD